MFIGGLSWQTTEGRNKENILVEIKLILFTESLKEYFSQFGTVAETMVMRDPTTKHSR